MLNFDENQYILIIAGTSKIPNLDENIGAAFVKLTAEEMQEVAAAVPEHDVAGHRQNEGHSKFSWDQVTTPPLSSYAKPQY